MHCIILKKCELSLLVLVILYSFPTFCASHSNEDPSFKYSRQANEKNIHDEFDHAHHSHEHAQFHRHEDNLMNKYKKNMSEIWLHSIGSTLFISTVPFLLLYVIPLDSSDEMRPRLKVLLAFASGGLLGDAFLHLIPHATHPHHSHAHSHGNLDDHSHDHSKETVIGLWVLFGIIAFLTVEKLVRILKEDENLNHGHSHATNKKVTESKSEKSAKSNKNVEMKKENVAVSGYLNLAADFAHNFTDGLAIGASYLAGNSIGIVTTVTILLHEVPHEIGDFAILIKSGCSRRKAMFLQLVTALGAISGNALALIGVGTDADTAPWVLPFTAGGFIYIATVSVLPELLEGSTKLGQSIKEICALLLGVILMTFIALFE